MPTDNVLPLKPKKGPSDDDPQLGLELGVNRTMPFSTWLNEHEILNTAKVPIDELVEMRRRDGQARALSRLFTLPILAAFKDAEWIETDDEGGEEEADFATQMWKLPEAAGGMIESSTMVLKQALQALNDGFAVFEEVRHIPEKGPLEGKITLESLAYRDPRTIRFRVDDKGRFNGVRQVTHTGLKTVDVIIPKNKVWYYAANEEENPFYGVSFFETAYYHYEIKKKLYYIAHLAAQFAAVPGRIGKVPANPDSRLLAQFKQGLMDFAFNTAMTVPEGWEVEPFNGNTGFKFIELIDHHNHMMSKSVLTGFLDEENRTVLIENSNATDASSDMFVLGLESIMDALAESWSSKLMPKYIDWNFGTDKYPQFKFAPLTDGDRDSIKEIFTSVVTAGMLNCTPEFVREMEKKLANRLGLDIDYEEIESHEKEAAEEQQAMEAEAAVQPPPPVGPDGQPLPPGAPGGFGGPPGAPPGPPGMVAASGVVPNIDDLVEAAQQLLLERPE